ncbi:MAG: OmpA family protein [Myxococcales bacterium]|nr:OmpA family protein [Myxococcales bacterium]
MDIDLDSLGDADCDCEEGAPPWMATFSDLATLLLTFFVLLLSFAEMDVVEFKEMMGSIRDAFGVQIERSGHIQAMATTPVELSSHESTLQMPLNDRELSALRAIVRFVRQREMQNDVEIKATDDGVVIRLKDRLVFPVGSDTLNEVADPVLDKISELARAFGAGLSVEGHTDDTPIQTRRFPSNWELSSARATAVLRHLQREAPLGFEQLRVIGYADTRPLAPNDSAENRARNRRVEFLIKRVGGMAVPSDPELQAALGVTERARPRAGRQAATGSADGVGAVVEAMVAPAGEEKEAAPEPAGKPDEVDAAKPRRSKRRGTAKKK